MITNEAISIYDLSLKNMEILADKFVTSIANLEVKIGRQAIPEDIEKLESGSLINILQLFCGLEIVSSAIKKNLDNYKVYPLWGKLINIYKSIPTRIINNFGGNTNFLLMEEELYNNSVKKLVSLN